MKKKIVYRDLHFIKCLLCCKSAVVVCALVCGAFVLSSYEGENLSFTPNQIPNTAIATDLSDLSQKRLLLDSIFEQMVTQNNFNGAILVAKGKQILFSKFVGYADFPSGKKINDSTMFELASVSKQFTAIAILMLYEDGKLKLTDSVQQYIPDFPYREINIHQLLCHRSGMPDYFKFADKFQKDKTKPIDNDSLLRMLKRHFQPLKFPPDSSFEYSNTGYAVLASIVERISKQKFTDFVIQRIFIPSGMKHTCFYNKTTYNSARNYAYGHRKDKTIYRKDYLSGIFGDKGIFTTAHDMFLYNKALDENKLLKAKTRNMAFEPQNFDLDECRNYGYGWRLGCDSFGNALVFHGGLWNGNNTLFIKRLDDDIMLLILSNIYNKGFSGRSSQILNAL